MTTVPVTSSTLAADALRLEIERRYAVRPTGCVLLARGLNDSYLVADGAARFVLRVYCYGWRTASDVEYEGAVLRHLTEKGVSVAAPVPMLDGAYVWSVAAPEGMRLAVLFEYASGGSADDPHPSAAFGRAAAAVHAGLDDFVWPESRSSLDWRYLVEEPIDAVRRFVPTRPDVTDALSRLGDELRRRLAEIDGSGHLDRGVCHGDLHGFNAHVTSDGTITVFDFDCCGPGWRAFDLGVFRWWQHFTGRPESVWSEFLAGYRGVRSLSEAD